MHIRLTTDRVDRGSFQQEGQVLDLPTEEARRLIAAGQAEPVTPNRPQGRARK